MSDDDYRDLVIKHDKHIDRVADSVEHLAKAVGSTNKKLEDVIDVIGTQNVLMEKFTNLETNLKDSFTRIYTRLEKIENTHSSSGGCPALKLSDLKDVAVNDRLKKLEGGISKLLWLIISGLVSGAFGTLILLIKGNI